MLNFDWANSISVEAARWIIIGMFVLMGIGVMFLPKRFIYAGIDNPRWYHNLKIWAIFALSIIGGTYLYF
jgi:hypothetical protein